MWPLADGAEADTVLLLHALEEFGGQFAALRDLAEHVSVHVSPLDDAEFDQRIERATSGSLDGLDDAQRERIARLGMSWTETLQHLPQEEFGAGFGIPVATAEGHDRLAHAQRAFNEMVDAYPDIERGGTFVIGFLDALTATRRSEVMHRAIITAAVGAFESLLRLLVTASLRASPGGASETQQRDTIRRLLRGGYQSWDRWCRTHLGVGLLDQSPHPRDLVEVFERRHLIVHSGALVDERYLERTQADGRVGVEVSTDAAYVVGALDLLVVVGLRLCLHAGAALDPALPHTAGVLTHHVARRHLLERRAWIAAWAMYEHLAKHADTDVLRSLARVHAWYARKQMGGLVSITDEVEAWIAPSPDFALARLSLLDRRDESLALARELLRSGALSRIDLRSSPALAWIPAALDEDTPHD
jgi:hypothetical protein